MAGLDTSWQGSSRRKHSFSIQTCQIHAHCSLSGDNNGLLGNCGFDQYSL